MEQSPSPGSHLAMRSDLSHKGRGVSEQAEAPSKNHTELKSSRSTRADVRAFVSRFDDGAF
jgi:hypothetical protein